MRPGAEIFADLLAAARGGPVAALASCGAGPSWLLHDPVEVLRVPWAARAGGLATLSGFLERHRDRRCVGYLGYDLRDAVEAIPPRIGPDLDLPVLWFAAFAGAAEYAPAAVPEAPAVPGASDLRLAFTAAEYRAAVADIVERICDGDLFQANLTQPFTAAWDGDPRALFWRLCHVSPAPFAAYLEDGDLRVLSVSPEEFLHRAGGTVRTRPIKGTSARDPDPDRDAAALADLRASTKDRAELAMIVDLLRNDLGKLARPGSVRVGPFPEAASFAQVHHLLATVRAELPPDTPHVELLRAVFPGGSITGAPKLRAMQVLEELERVRRGVYTGALGWIGPGPALHLNVAIRTLLLRGRTARFHAGGGVTARSDPEAEWRESLHKARGIARALGLELGG